MIVVLNHSVIVVVSSGLVEDVVLDELLLDGAVVTVG